jgi:maltose/moltooligosaccharide transporter
MGLSKRIKGLDLSVGYLGLQIAFGIQSASLSRVFQGLGASVDQLAVLWLAGPVTGLLVQPVVGAISDRHGGRFGRRRPYILISALLVIAALAALPMATSLMVAVVVVWGLEAAMNALHAPYRALVADTLPPEDQASGYAMQTVFIGLGALAGACAPILLAWGGWSNVAQPGQTAPSIRVAFLVAALAVALAVGWTVARVREPVLAFTPQHDPSARLGHRGDFAALWRALRPVAAIQFLSWFGLYLLWVYATPVVAAQLYAATSPFDAAYARGADFVGILFGTYNGVAGLFAFLLPGLFRRFGMTRVHAVALVAGALGLAGLAFVPHPAGLVACAVLIGIAYASILSAPFVLAGRAVSSATAGLFIGVMNIFIVVPQLVAGLSMGWVIAHALGGMAWPVLPLAGGLMAMGAVLSLCLSTMDEDAAPA